MVAMSSSLDGLSFPELLPETLMAKPMTTCWMWTQAPLATGSKLLKDRRQGACRGIFWEPMPPGISSGSPEGGFCHHHGGPDLPYGAFGPGIRTGEPSAQAEASPPFL